MLFGFGFPWFEGGVDTLSHWVVGAGPIGLFLYGFLNRMLLVTGLHHILNNIAWFLLGDFHGATGDLKRFFAGDPTAGSFMAGFFPVMMFGLPAACLAMYRNALPERRTAVGGLLLSVALTSLLTGVTEPIEFLFIFLAPLLFVVHAILTGLAMVIMDALGVKLGFGFSAGLFDYVLNFGLATRPLLLLPVGAVYFAVYYVTFGWCIRRFNLATPGRELTSESPAHVPLPSGDRGSQFAAALGGAKNLKSIDACMTRLRLEVIDAAVIDEPALRALGAKAIVRPGGDSLQVVLGPIADQIAGEIRAAAAARRPTGDPDMVTAITEALRPARIQSVEARGSRLLIGLDDPSRLSASDLDQLGLRGWVLLPRGLQIIIGPGADAIAEALSVALAGA